MVSELSPLPGGDEPVAIVGVGCRFPGGANSPQALWEALTQGIDASGPLPEERWAAHRAQSRENAAVLSRVISRGNFLDDISGFDAAFFGISATEARQLDPQQRLALEVSWEALEHAGIPASTLAGTDAGVFLGVGVDDYGRRLLEDLPNVQAWTGIGSSLCGVPNRVSYTLDLRGPSLAVDTACSSSLVALHQACAALRAGEVPLALAGGVMLMAGPGLTAVLDVAGAISPDGRSKAFDEAADGYGRGEGCGVVVLKLLSDARRDGDDVLALIRGTAVHQDGRTDGIMAPSPTAQAHLLRRAYAAAGIAPGDVDYVEAHGTGTKVGDPIEAAGLAAVVGERTDPRRPCLIGSVKTNIGHLEAAAGVAGLIKTVLAMRYGVIPATLTTNGPRQDIPWEASGLSLVTEETRWPETGRPRLAGVASYGYGGTIAHVVLEQAPAAPESGADRADSATATATATAAGTTAAGEAGEGAGLTLFPLSAATLPGVSAQAARLVPVLDRHELADTGHTLAHRRAHLGARGAVVAADAEELGEALRALAAGEAHPSVVTGESSGAPARPVWVFSGHGAQWSGMGRELLATEPEFAAAVDRIGPVYAEELGVTPREVLQSGELGSVDIVQSMLFAVQVGLTAVWRRYGVEPGAIIGHSVGEIAAAVAAGVLTETDGARLVCRRSALLRKVAGQGAMVMVDRPFDEIEAELDGRTDLCAAIAAAPSSTVVAGDIPAVEAVAVAWTDEGRTVRRIDSDVAFHSAHMDGISAELAVAVAGLKAARPQVPLYLTALDDPRSTRTQDASYWAANLRNPVRFADAVRAAAEDGHRLFLEISAHPVVSHSVTETLSQVPAAAGALVTPSLRRAKPERATLLTSLARLHCHHVDVDWTVLQPTGRLCELPTAAWQHERHWVDGTYREPSPVDTLLGEETSVQAPRLSVWRTTLDLRTRPYPRRHPVLGTEIVPAAVLINTFLTAADTDTLTEVRLRRPVVVREEDTNELQVVADDSGLRLLTRPLGGSATSWSTHTQAVPGARGGEPDAAEHAPRTDTARGTDSDSDPRDEDTEVLDNGYVIERLAELGVADMGYPWEITELRRTATTLTATATADLDRSWAAVLDAALSTASVIFSGPAVLRMPAHIDRVTFSGPPPRAVSIVARLDETEPTTVHCEVRELPHDTGDMDDTDDTDATNGTDATDRAEGASGTGSWLTLTGLRYGELDGSFSGRAASTSGRFVQEWQPFPVDATAHSTLTGRTVLVIGPDGLAPSLVPACAAQGATVTVEESALAGTHHVLFAPEGEDPEAAAARFARLVREIAALPGAKPKLWCLTPGTRQAATDAGIAGASLWGMGRVAASEHPDFWGAVVDLPAAGPVGETDAALLLSLLHLHPDEPVLSLADGGVHVPRLVPAQSGTRGDDEPFRCRPDGTYLITGGLGVLGLELAGHLAERGARRLVLLGRTAVPPRALWEDGDRRVEALRRLEAAGATVRTVAADITDLEATRKAIDALELPPVRGVVHAAGTVHSALLHAMQDEHLRDVMRPKVEGARVLHELFPPGSTDFFVLFSSAGPLLGLPGQGAYAAANCYLDALAAHRRTGGHTESVSIAWTSWRGMGMATAAKATDMELAARGTADITPEQALRAFDRTAAGAESSLVAVLGLLHGHDGPRPALLAELATGSEESGPAEVPDWVGLTGQELAEYLLDVVRTRVAEVLGVQPAAVGIARPLTEAGVDSLLAAAVRVSLERDLVVALPATLLWNHPTVADIAGHLTGVLESRSRAATEQQRGAVAEGDGGPTAEELPGAPSGAESVSSA